MTKPKPSSDKVKGDSEDLAKNRTAMAEDRTLMANERTFSSWTGTGLGCIGIGIGVQAIFKEADPTWLGKLAATIFMAAAIAFFYSAWRKACGTLQRLEDHDANAVSRTLLTRNTIGMCIGTLLVTFILWTI